MASTPSITPSSTTTSPSQPSSAHTILDDLLSGRSRAELQSFREALRGELLYCHYQYILVIILWNSIGTDKIDLELRPLQQRGEGITVRFTKRKNSTELFVYAQVHASKAELDDYKPKEKPCVLLPHRSYAEYAAKAWVVSPNLCKRPVVFEDIDTLSFLATDLIAKCKLSPSQSIKMTISLVGSKIAPFVEAEIRHQAALADATTAVELMNICFKPNNFIEYVDKYRDVCIYNETLPLQVLAIPGGVGFIDLLPKRYIIEPFLAITTDTLFKPLTPLSEAEESQLLAANADSPLKYAIRKYYVLRKNSREDITRERLPELLSFGCYATTKVLFETQEQAELVIGKLYITRGIQHTPSHK